MRLFYVSCTSFSDLKILDYLFWVDRFPTFLPLKQSCSDFTALRVKSQKKSLMIQKTQTPVARITVMCKMHPSTMTCSGNSPSFVLSMSHLII